ncbi:type II toxin-antitoxin system RelE/ParE family toxin [Chryseobacterium indoltheticum]|uniref:type II toxin-antitoxin system RelE/ParE family toxin n=1 Tax=Chryseobacterium indoltheticum TaxID=254 RepID=UPI001913C36A|nr:type II toxin-antitoxin system RelE/ParE family toxin [Chryseobacterium indoltheticum]QQQ28345.1 type II toxin-antitoxin system RelE/ParE family toxin [Chryseobacterium indoltheticum]
MDEIKIFWTKIAQKQRDVIFEYYNNRNKSFIYSKKLKSEIKEYSNILKQQPEIGKKITNSDLRNIFFGNYSLIYKRKLNIIYIAAFWDNRQNPEKLSKILGL